MAAGRQAARRSNVQRGLGALHARFALQNRMDDRDAPSDKKSLPAFGEPAFERGYAGRQIDFHAEVHHGPAERVHGAEKVVLTTLLAHLADTNDWQSKRARDFHLMLPRNMRADIGGGQA